MSCRTCASSLARPGDYCLVCHTENADTVVLELSRDRARVTALREESIQGAREITTTPEAPDAEARLTELRNFAGLIADELRRKRPEAVYATGNREVLRSVRAQVHYDFYRIDADEPVQHVLDGRGEPALAVVEGGTAEKLGGSHTTLIGDRDGRRAIETVADHPHVKKIIPGPIDASGGSSRGGLRAKATRADGNGNVRLLLREGSSVQENRVVTTASDRQSGERVRDDLNTALAAADLQAE